jgi:hypothetical protein
MSRGTGWSFGFRLSSAPGTFHAVRLTSPLVAALLVSVAVSVRADDLADFQRARNAYDTGDYPLAAQRFDELLQREPPPSRAIREECLQYLGASLLFQGNSRDAGVAFERLLVLEPEWEMDPAVFPTPILDEFAQIKAEMRERLQALQAAEQQLAELERQRRAEEERLRREALEEALRPRYLLREDQDRSLFLAFVPFGVGQFQNGHDTKGWTFFGIETALFAANAWTFFAWDWYTRERAGASGARAEQAASFAEGYKIASWAILGTLLATMAAGVIDSLVGYYAEPETGWRLVSEEDVPEDQRLPVRDPDEFLPPHEPGPDEAPPTATLGLTLSFPF